MDNWTAVIILAIVQGIAEWFPISSSGHLVLVSAILNYPNTLLLDVSLHLGSLLAAIVYFSKDITNILIDTMTFKFKSENGKTGLYVIIATIPAVIFGYIMKDFIRGSLNNLNLLALGFGITGIVLIITSLEVINPKRKNLTLMGAVIIGFAQVASLFRGISRTGSTTATGILLGLDSKRALRFSFLMSIPIIFGANLLEMGTTKLSAEYIIPTIISFFVALLSIHFLFRFVVRDKKNLRWFGIYVLCLSAGILIYKFLI